MSAKDSWRTVRGDEARAGGLGDARPAVHRDRLLPWRVGQRAREGHEVEDVVGVQVGDDHRVHGDVVAVAAQLAEDAAAAVQQDAGPGLLDEISTAGTAGVLPRRRLAEHRDAQAWVLPPVIDRDTTRMPVLNLPLATGTTDEFAHVVVVLGGLLMLGALLSGVTHRSFLAMTPVFVLAGFALGNGGLGVLDFDRQLAVRRRRGDGRPHRHPLPRRSGGRGRTAAEGVAPARAQARRRDADHRGGRRGRDPCGDRPVVDPGVPRRGPAVPHRPGALLGRGDEPAGAAARAPLAQPRVRPQRRAGAGPGARARDGRWARGATISSSGASSCRTWGSAWRSASASAS